MKEQFISRLNDDGMTTEIIKELTTFKRHEFSDKNHVLAWAKRVFYKGCWIALLESFN